MARILTDLGVRNAKPKRATEGKHKGELVCSEIPDAGCRGLYLVVQPSGGKSWGVRYRFGKRTRKLTLGAVFVANKGEPVPEHALTLALARKRCTEALHKLAQGVDPAGEKALAKPSTPKSLASVAEDCFTREAKRLRSAQRQLNDLRRLVFPDLGSRPIGSIRRGELVRLLDKIEDNQGPVMANSVLAALSKVMRWWAIRDEDFSVPLVAGMRRSSQKERARDRVLTDAELKALWNTTGESQDPFAALVRFLLLTCARRTEASAMRRSEISADQVWLLPASRNKVKVALSRPLSKAAQAVLSSLPRIADSDLVFTLDGRKPINKFASGKRALDKSSGVTGWRLHDLRRSARTLLSRAGVPDQHAERCLGHVIGGVKAVYDQHKYQVEMLAAYEKLAVLFESIVNPQPNVIPLHA